MSDQGGLAGNKGPETTARSPSSSGLQLERLMLLNEGCRTQRYSERFIAVVERGGGGGGSIEMVVSSSYALQLKYVPRGSSEVISNNEVASEERGYHSQPTKPCWEEAFRNSERFQESQTSCDDGIFPEAMRGMSHDDSGMGDDSKFQ